MNFLAPQRLVLLLGVGALVIAYVLLQTRRRSYAVKFTNLALLDRVAPRKPGWRRHVPAILFLLALTTLVVGFAEPTREVQVPRERATIMLALDVSRSMEATDVAPNRIDAAKSAANDFIDLLPPKINVGLVLFAGNASMKVAPTTDRAALKRAVNEIRLANGTAIGEAIFASLDGLSSVPPDGENTPAPARIVLMSDGATNQGRPNEDATAEAAKQGVPVYTIAFGTDRGTIQLPDEPFPVRVPVDAEALQQIADATQAKSYSATSEGQLKEVYDNIGSSIGYTTEEREVSSWFIGGALVILALVSVFSLAWFSRLP